MQNLIIAVVLTPMGVAALIGVFCFTKFSKAFKIVSVYLVYTFLQQLLALWSGRNFGTNTLISNIYIFVSILSYSMIVLAFGVKGMARKIILLSTIFALLVCVLVFLFIQGLESYPTFNHGVNALFITFTSFIYLSVILDRPAEKVIFEDNKLLLVAIFLLFFMPSLFVFPVLNYVGQHFGPRPEYNYLIFALNFIFYSLLSFVLLRERKVSMSLND